jgi:hypothetical protein
MTRRTFVPRPAHQFLSDDMWALADNRYFSTFCLRAHLVDDFEPLGFGERALALAVHDGPGTPPVTDEDFDALESVAVSFSTLEISQPWLWRCDVERPQPMPFQIGLAGAYNKELLEEFRNASVLFLVEVQWFEIWTMEHVFAVIPNDQDFWRSRESNVPDWRFP